MSLCDLKLHLAFPGCSFSRSVLHFLCRTRRLCELLAKLALQLVLEALLAAPLCAHQILFSVKFQ